MSFAKLNRFRWLLVLTILVTCIGCDQATKHFATRSLANQPRQSLLADTIRLEYVQNPGGFLSLGGNLPQPWRQWVFISVNLSLMVVLGVLLAWRRDTSLALFVALSYILAGGLGNLIDRVAHDGLVTDFLNVGIGSLRTGIFNVADIAVTFGGIAAVVFMPRKAGATDT